MLQLKHLALAAALAAASAPALAEDIETAVALLPDGMSFSAMVSVTHLTSGLFVDTLSFDLPAMTVGSVTAEFSSVDPNIALVVGAIEGISFDFTSSNGGLFGSITLDNLSGPQTLTLLGGNGDPFDDPAPLTGSYSGSISFTPSPVAAIPEPGTYALMLAGLGLIGFMAQRRRRR